jgi:predicted RNase H-like nuclease
LAQQKNIGGIDQILHVEILSGPIYFGCEGYPMRSVLGIDAAWTLTQPSGVALATETSGGWQLEAVSKSYLDFLRLGTVTADANPMKPNPAAMIRACDTILSRPPDLVAIDMPVAHSPITSRRASDNAVSREYGGRWASTHSPSAERPGKIADDLKSSFTTAGYPLSTAVLTCPSLIEVYPHPALIELLDAEKRLPYKISNRRKYWPDHTADECLDLILSCWQSIVTALDAHISGVADKLPVPPRTSKVAVFKSFEDSLDAVVCAWVAICALDGKAKPFGDASSAIWIPLPLRTAIVRNPNNQIERFKQSARQTEDKQSKVEIAKSAKPQVGKKVCPECGHIFKGNGWDGIDAHWRSKHERILPYEEAWPLLKSGKYNRGAM